MSSSGLHTGAMLLFPRVCNSFLAPSEGTLAGARLILGRVQLILIVDLAYACRHHANLLRGVGLILGVIVGSVRRCHASLFIDVELILGVVGAASVGCANLLCVRPEQLEKDQPLAWADITCRPPPHQIAIRKR